MERIAKLEERVSALEGAEIANPENPKPTRTKDISIREFLLARKPSGDVQKTLAIGYYLETHEKISPFNISDLTKYFELAKEPTPENINDKINLNIKKGHLTEAKNKKENKKAWIVTNSGEQFLESGFKNKT